MPHVISRRHFLAYAPAVFSATAWLRAAAATATEGIIMTVNGPIAPADLGVTLPHEHVLVDFVGADNIGPGRYDEHEAYRVILPHLLSLREKGCRSLVECTPGFLGRDPRLLQRLSLAAGLHLITNTGLYGAAAHKYLPAYVQQETAKQLANRWISEWKQGIGDTRIKPGFIKSGMDKGPLSPLQRKLVEAAAITWRQTGLPIGIHSGDGAAALEEAAILKEKNVPLSAWIWIHAQNEKDMAIHDQLARAGAWVSLDGLNKENAQDYITRLTRLKQNGYLQQVLLSHDAGWYHVGQAGGGEFNNYNYLLTEFIPLLKQHGFTEDELHVLTVKNPARAFTIHSPSAGA